jgi:hypothetical protein
MTVVNTGSVADRLISASTPVAGEAEVHRTTNENGVMKMNPAGAIDVAPGTPVVLSPGALHLMMTDLKTPLVEGQTFPLTLVFEKAGKVEVAVHIQRTAPANAAAGPAIVSPSDGASVTSPVTVIIAAPAAPAMGGMAMGGSDHMHDMSGSHFHLIVDAPLPKPGTTVPVDGQHIHLMGNVTQATLDLAPGKHTLQLVVGGMDHKVPPNAAHSALVTITVQ